MIGISSVMITLGLRAVPGSHRHNLTMYADLAQFEYEGYKLWIAVTCGARTDVIISTQLPSRNMDRGAIVYRSFNVTNLEKLKPLNMAELESSIILSLFR